MNAASGSACVGRLVRGSASFQWSREVALYLGYVTLSSLSIVGVVAFWVLLIAHIRS